MKLRIYADTSVLGGCEDEEFAELAVQGRFAEIEARLAERAVKIR